MHDYLLVMRGAERTFAAMAECWPRAPIYSLLYDEAGTDRRFAGREVHTSFLQRLGVGQQGFRRLLPLFPYAASRLDVSAHDVVVSSSSAFGHGVRTAESAVHVCYCHTPFRYAWYEEERALGEVPAPVRPVLRTVLRRNRAWDRAAAGRVTHYIANSQITQERIARFYGREASIVHPPVETERFHPAEPEDYLLVVCEIVRHKRVETALQAARAAGLPIKVVGSGPDRERLEALYADSAEFLGRVDDASLVQLHQRALALVVPNVEEFGIAAVEAMASGRPVVAAGAGGALETVVDGVTGVFFTPGDVDALTEVLRHTDFTRFDPPQAVERADRFSKRAFKERISTEVERLSGAAQSG